MLLRHQFPLEKTNQLSLNHSLGNIIFIFPWVLKEHGSWIYSFDVNLAYNFQFGKHAPYIFGGTAHNIPNRFSIRNYEGQFQHIKYSLGLQSGLGYAYKAGRIEPWGEINVYQYAIGKSVSDPTSVLIPLRLGVRYNLSFGKGEE